MSRRIVTPANGLRFGVVLPPRADVAVRLPAPAPVPCAATEEAYAVAWCQRIDRSEAATVRPGRAS